MPKIVAENELVSLAKRLADYVGLTIEVGGLRPNSPIGIAYRDFMEEWDRTSLLDKAVPDATFKTDIDAWPGTECPEVALHIKE